MNFNQELSLLDDLSDQDQELISGGAIVFGSFSGSGSSSSSSSTASFSIRDGITTGSGSTFTQIVIDGIVIEEDSKSFTFGPTTEPFSFSFSSSLPRRRGA
jgi:hypothetical protein